MTQTLAKDDRLTRFVSCADDVSLLQETAVVVTRVLVGEMYPIFPAEVKFSGGFTSGSKQEKNLTRGGIFRGKVSQRKTQPK
jgi:hypothetical protein